jgi:hypothetical protein
VILDARPAALLRAESVGNGEPLDPRVERSAAVLTSVADNAAGAPLLHDYQYEDRPEAS